LYFFSHSNHAIVTPQDDVNDVFLGTESEFQKDLRLRHQGFKRRESIQKQKSWEVPTGLRSTATKTVRIYFSLTRQH